MTRRPQSHAEPIPLEIRVEPTARYRAPRETLWQRNSSALKVLGAVFAGITVAIMLGTVVVHVTSSVVQRDEFEQRDADTSKRFDGIDLRLRAVETAEGVQAAALAKMAEAQQKMNEKLDKALERRRRR